MNRRNDLTTGTEWKRVLLFALPVMGGQFLQQLYVTADGIIVGNFVGDTALAAVGCVAPLTMLFVAFAIGLSNGGGIMTAQFYGAKRFDELRRGFSTAMILLVGTGALLMTLGLLFARFMVGTLLNVEAGELQDMAVTYFSIICVGLPFGFAYNSIAALLRAMGDSKATMMFLAVASVINIALDLLFVVVFKWSVAGAAVATSFSKLCSFAFSVMYTVKTYPMLRYGRGEFVLDREMSKTCLKLGVPSMVQQGVVSCGNLFLQRLVNSFGEITMAAFTAATRVENYMMIPILSFGTGMSNFTGQNMGAGKHDRIKRCWRQTAVMSVICCIPLSVAAVVFASPLSSLFGIEGEALAQSAEYIRFAAPFFVEFALYMTTTALLQGAGDVKYALLCSLASLTTRVAVSYLMAGSFAVGYASVWRSIPFGWTFCLALALVRFFAGTWRKKGIIQAGETGEA